MAEQLIYACKLKEGIHARPAGHIERLCNTFSADISWSNSRTGITANAKSALALVGTDTLFQDECKITLSGDDEFDACVQLADLLEKYPCRKKLTPKKPQMSIFPCHEPYGKLTLYIYAVLVLAVGSP